ncbi:MAG: peptide MFS transporter [Sphingomonas sp.]
MKAQTVDRHDRSFLGHPRGLGFLAFSEGGTAFSYYGMQSLLVLYMANELLKPQHVGQVWGFAAFHAFLETLYGPLTLTATATAITGLFGGIIYAMPIIGGFVADRWLGRTPTLITGAVLMTAGHFLMSFYATFLIALAAILVGAGCFNANLRAQIGELYTAGDTRRADAFQIYAMAVSVAVIAAPLVCGTLGEEAGFSYGFIAAGTGMALGLVVYLAGRRWMPAEPPRAVRAERTVRPPLGRQERGTVLLLIALLVPIALTFVGNQQIFNAYLLWGEAHYQLRFFGHVMPVSWLLSLDAFISTGCLFGAVMFWRWYDRRRGDPAEITKMVIGAAISALAPLVLAAAVIAVGPHGKVSLAWGLAFHIVNDIGFANLYPVGMALYSRVSPPQISATMISIFSLSIFVGTTLAGWLGGFLTTMSGPSFWAMHAVVVAAGAALLLLVRQVAARALAPRSDVDRDEGVAALRKPMTVEI